MALIGAFSHIIISDFRINAIAAEVSLYQLKIQKVKMKSNVISFDQYYIYISVKLPSLTLTLNDFELNDNLCQQLTLTKLT